MDRRRRPESLDRHDVRPVHPRARTPATRCTPPAPPKSPRCGGWRAA
jgi:hypothetical protein